MLIIIYMMDSLVDNVVRMMAEEILTKIET